jgi:hypothetical protein
LTPLEYKQLTPMEYKQLTPLEYKHPWNYSKGGY